MKGDGEAWERNGKINNLKKKNSGGEWKNEIVKGIETIRKDMKKEKNMRIRKEEN